MLTATVVLGLLGLMVALYRLRKAETSHRLSDIRRQLDALPEPILEAPVAVVVPFQPVARLSLAKRRGVA